MFFCPSISSFLFIIKSRYILRLSELAFCARYLSAISLRLSFLLKNSSLCFFCILNLLKWKGIAPVALFIFSALSCYESSNQSLFLNLFTNFFLLFIINIILKESQQNKTVFIIIIEAYLEMTEVNKLASTFQKEQNKTQTIEQEIKSKTKSRKEIDCNVGHQNNQFVGLQSKLDKESLIQTSINQKEESTSFSFDAQATKSFSQTERKGKQSRYKLQNKNTPALKDIQEEKKQVEQQLKMLDQQINQIRHKHKVLSKQKQKEKQRIQQQALKNAKSLVQRYKVQNKQDRQRKIKQREKSIQEFKKLQQSFKNIHIQQEKHAKQEKRRVITLRIQEVKKKQEQRISIQQQRNKVVTKIIKQQHILKQKEKLPEKIAELQQKKAQLYEKKEQFNIKEIEEHQRKYIERKQLQKSQVINRKSASLSHPIPKFKKNIWAQRLQVQQERKKSQQKQKELSRKKNLENKMKYSELVKNIFLPKKKQRLMTEVQVTRNAGTPDIFHNKSIHLPTICESQKRINDTKLMKKFRQNNKVKMNISQQSSQKQKSSRKVHTQIQAVSVDQQQRKRIQRLIQLKKQTQERLKKIEEKRQQRLFQADKKTKSVYKNYLGSFKLKRKSNPKDWKKIIDSNKLSNEQKYVQMMKKVSELQTQAQQNEYKQKQGKQISVELYINSIQAKLALLQKF